MSCRLSCPAVHNGTLSVVCFSVRRWHNWTNSTDLTADHHTLMLRIYVFYLFGKKVTSVQSNIDQSFFLPEVDEPLSSVLISEFNSCDACCCDPLVAFNISNWLRNLENVVR